MKNPAKFSTVTITTCGVTRTYDLHGRMHPSINKARREGQNEVFYFFEGRLVQAKFA